MIRCVECGNPLGDSGLFHACPVNVEAAPVALDAPARRRFVYRQDETGEVHALEVGGDWSDAPRDTGDGGKFEYDGAAARATDGADISSRTKRREYMKREGVADSRDFREAGPKARAVRDALHQFDTKAHAEERKRDIYQAIQSVRRKRR